MSTIIIVAAAMVALFVSGSAQDIISVSCVHLLPYLSSICRSKQDAHHILHSRQNTSKITCLTCFSSPKPHLHTILNSALCFSSRVLCCEMRSCPIQPSSRYLEELL